MYQNPTGVPNVTTVTNVPKMTKNDHSVPIFGYVHFYGLMNKPIINTLKFKTATGRHIENRSSPHFLFVFQLHVGLRRAAAFVLYPIETNK